MIFLILIFAFFIRVISLNQSLWFDEAINVVYAQRFNFWDFVTKYPLGDFHPPLWFALLWVWVRLNNSEVIIRLLPVFFGVATVYITYLSGKEFSKKVGIFSSMLLAIAPLHIYYSQEARPYSLAAFAVSLSSYFFIKLLKKNDLKFLTGYILSSALVFYSDYVAYFLFPAQIIYLLLHEKQKIQKVQKAFLISLIIYSPWILVFRDQFSQGITTASSLTGWKEVVGGVRIKEIGLLWVKSLIGKVSFDNMFLYALVSVFVSINYLLILGKVRKKILELDYIFLWLIVPPLLAFLISFFVPVFSYFRFIFILPAFYLLVSIGLERLGGKLRIIALVALIVMQSFFSLMYLLNPKFHREDWKGAVKFINQQANSNSLIIFENNEIPAPVIYYQTDPKIATPGLERIPAQTLQDLKIINMSKNPIYLFEYLAGITDPERLLEKQLQSLGYKKIETYDFRGVGFIHQYAKAQ